MATTFYDIDFASIVNVLLPVRLRKMVTNSWLNCLVKPVKDIYDQFAVRRSDTIYQLAHNSQVVYLQAALNDMFDGVARRIYISDGIVADPLYVYLEAEGDPLWLGLDSEIGTTSYPDPQGLYTDTETSVAGYQFIVMVPSDLIYDALRMTALIERYRTPSKSNYTIVTF